MAREFTINAPKRTYKNETTLRDAIFKYPAINDNNNLRYFIEWTKDGRCFPVFVGESAITAGIHFYFNVVA